MIEKAKVGAEVLNEKGEMLFEGKWMPITQVGVIEAKQRFGVKGGNVAAFGVTKREYNRMIGEIRNSLPDMPDLAKAFFSFAE